MDDKHRNLVDEVVDGIIAELQLDSRIKAANLSQIDIQTIRLMVTGYIRNRLDQMHPAVKNELMRDCLERSEVSLENFDPATAILRELWKRLRVTHKLSDVKWG